MNKSEISRRHFLKLSTLAAAGAVAVACTKTDAAPTQAPDVPPTATAKAKEPEPEAVKDWPRKDVPRNRTLIRMFSALPNVGIVGLYAGGNHQASGAAEQEAMFYYAALNDTTYSHLAESFEYNDDATELTVYLRKGVEWSDGTPFTANDIAFTYNTLIDKAPDYSDSSRIANLTKEVVAVDDHTVKFVLTSPNYRYHFTECTFRFDRRVVLVPEHIFKDVEDWREFGFYDPEKGWPVVTGAWQTTIFETQQSKTLDLRYDWWAAKTGFMDMPQVERIIHLPFTEETKAAQMVINNEIDHCLDLRPRTIESILAQAPQVITHSGRNKPYGYVDWWPISLHINNLEWPYQDPRVRWALAYAINQDQLVEVGWAGAGETSNGPFPYYPGIMKYYGGIKDILDKYNVLETDLDKVEELMTEAGFEKDDEGFWVQDGKRPDTDIYAGVPLFGDIAPVIAEQLRKAGFDSTHVTPPDVWARKNDGTGFLALFGHGGSVKDPFTTLDMYHSRNVKPTGEGCGWVNIARWSDDGYDVLIEELSQTSPELEPEKCQDLFNKAMAIWYEKLPEVPLVQWFHRIPMNTTYWTNWPDEKNPYNSALWHITMPITLWNLKATS